MEMFLKILLIVVGVLLILNVVFLAFISNYNAGWIFTLVVGGFFLIYGLYFQQINDFMSHGFLLSLRCLIYGVLGFFLGVVIFLGVYGNTDTVNYQEDAIIVLGAGLRRDRVSLTLAKRLNAAYEYWQENPDAFIVTTGGQGPQETVPEGESEAKYLLGLGVPEEKILIENQSSSTKENFLFAKAILDEKLGDRYTVAYVTNGFHIYRAGKIAADAGLTATHCHGGLSWYMVPVTYIREFAAVVVYWL